MSPCWTVNVNAKPEWPKYTPVAVGDKIYFFSSYYNSEEDLTTPIEQLDVQVFDTETYQWSVLTDTNFSQINETLPRALQLQSAVVHNEKVYLFADIKDQDWNVLFCFDTNSHIWSKPIVSGMVPAVRHRAGHSTCVVNDSILIFGGFDRNSTLDIQGLYKLDLKSMKWSYVPTKGEPPMDGAGYSATAINNNMFIFGGYGDDGPPHFDGGFSYNDVVYLDTQTMTWITPEVVGHRPDGRSGHSAVCYKGQLFVFGGLNSDEYQDSDKFLNDLWRYDPDSRSWSLVETKGNRPCPRFEQSCFLIQDRLFLCGGQFIMPPNSVLNKALLNQHIRALDFAPSLKTLSILAVLEYKLDQKCLPETIQADIKLIYSGETQSGNNLE